MSPDSTVSKRSFLKLGLIINGVVGALLAVPVVRYLLSPATKAPTGADAWIALGKIADFPIGETRLATFRNPVEDAFDGATAELPCWVRRVDAEKFQVFAINCAHLGCPVRWFPESNLFLCPCHGGAYYSDGSRASGPPERGLFEYRYTLKAEQLWIIAGDLPTPGLVSTIEGKRHLRCV